MQTLLTLFVLLAIPLLIAGWLFLAMRNAQAVRDKREAIEKQFQALVPYMAGSAPGEPSSVSVLNEKEEAHPRLPTLRITRIVRNARGEYYRFNGGDSDEPALMRLSDEEARRALG